MKRLNSLSQAQSRMKSLIFIIMLLAAFPFSGSFGNNLVVTNVVLNQTGGTGGTVTFDLSWDNSWRKSDWTAKNWDAAWVFVKWRACSDTTTIAFTHGLVSTIVADHSFGGSTILEPTKGDGTVGIDAAPNNTGLMLRRSADGTTGAVTATVTMKIATLPSSATTLDFRVYGIEMVFVPAGSYVLGDGDGSQSSVGSFSSIYSPSAPNINAQAIINEGPQVIYEVTSSPAPNICGSTGCSMSSLFPKGYAAFYMMKYEISQGQFTDFLNAINTDAQTTHYSVPPNGVNTNLNRMSIIFNITPPTPYVATRPDRACNYLSWINFTAYLDWATLRPLTELEYEKACRGPEQNVPAQKAWGIKSGTPPATTSIIGTENGTETVTSGINVNVGAIQWTSGDGNNIKGPLRCGIFATSATTGRRQTGMGFYGNMELSGNVAEYYISALSGSNSSSNPSYNGVTLGDGVLNNTSSPGFGYHNNSSWPSAASPGSFIIRRGGDWGTTNGSDSSTLRPTNISFRATGTGEVTWAYNEKNADQVSGGRGGRSLAVSNFQAFVYTGSMQNFTVPAGVTSLTIEATGAGAGASGCTSAGLGAFMKGSFTVTPGEVLKVLVGGSPQSCSYGGGGGGTFVVRTPYTALSNVLIVAGGGGGQGSTTGTKANSSGQPHGGNGGAGYNNAASGGINGAGGNSSVGYGGGGGFLGNGANYSSYGGASFVNGGAGASCNCICGAFGGGGANCDNANGGGGGGYSGGGNSSNSGSGGGGGSYINGTIITNLGGLLAPNAQGSHGLVTFYW